MIKIRLKKTGKRNQTFYRVVVANAREKRNGRIIEALGFYDPKSESPIFKVNQKRLDYWLSRGAQPTTIIRKWLRK